MENNYKKHLFVPPKKGTMETLSAVVDYAQKPLSRIFNQEESMQKKVKRLRDDMIQYNRVKK